MARSSPVNSRSRFAAASDCYLSINWGGREMENAQDAQAMTRMAFTGELDDVTNTVMANWRYL